VEALNVAEAGLDDTGESVEQFPVGRKPRLDPGRLHPRLDVSQQGRVVRRRRRDGFGQFCRAFGHALRNDSWAIR